MLTKKDLEHLAELARIKLSTEKESRLLNDLEKILAHFEELKVVNTDGIEPMTGGTFLVNEFRDDKAAEKINNELAIEQFPEKQKGFLKVPPVFEGQNGEL